MRRLARDCVNSLAILAIALSFGAATWAQGKPAKKPARRARTAAAAKAKSAVKPKVAARPKAVARPKVARKPAAKAPAPAAAPAAQAAAPPAAPASEGVVDLVGKRDPFVALVNTSKGGNEHLPPGKAGLVIGTLTVQGAVQSANGMIAVIANPDQRVYFVREGDRLYDGTVEKISLDGVTFQQNTKDAFGKPIERTVVKRIYPSAGEQQ
jgi:Tfp pilus assembly protein PilP